MVALIGHSDLKRLIPRSTTSASLLQTRVGLWDQRGSLQVRKTAEIPGRRILYPRVTFWTLISLTRNADISLRVNMNGQLQQDGRKKDLYTKHSMAESRGQKYVPTNIIPASILQTKLMAGSPMGTDRYYIRMTLGKAGSARKTQARQSGIWRLQILIPVLLFPVSPFTVLWMGVRRGVQSHPKPFNVKMIM